MIRLEFVWRILEFFCMLVKFIPSSGPRRGCGSLTEYFRKKKSHAHLRDLTIICNSVGVLQFSRINKKRTVMQNIERIW